MTRGGYGESNPERKTHANRRGIESLARRPAPDPADATGGFPWARRYNWDESDQSIASGSEINVALADFGRSPNDGTYFTAYDSGSADGIHVVQDGLYAITVRLFWAQWPGDHAVIMNGIDPDAWAGYAIGMTGAGGANTVNVSGALVVRLGAGQDIYPTVYHQFGSARTLEGSGGTFFEMVRLGSVDVSEPRSGNSP